MTEQLYSDMLRTEAKEMRVAVKEMLDTLSARASSLSAELEQISRMPGMPEEAQQSLTALSEEYRSVHQKMIEPLCNVIVGATTANVYDALADHSEYLMGKGAQHPVVDKLKEQREQQQALRMAAAAGDWKKFDALVRNQIERQTEAGSDQESV